MHAVKVNHFEIKVDLENCWYLIDISIEKDKCYGRKRWHNVSRAGECVALTVLHIV